MAYNDPDLAHLNLELVKLPINISVAEILMGREKEYPLSVDLIANLTQLMIRINLFRYIYDNPLTITSGYRPGHYNKDVGGATNSCHMSCEAVDISDGSGELKRYIKNNPTILDRCDLYQEHPDHTPTWVHLDIRKRMNRVFVP